MNTNQYTQKTLEALQAAQQLAVEYQHNALEPEHLLHARCILPDRGGEALVQCGLPCIRCGDTGELRMSSTQENAVVCVQTPLARLDGSCIAQGEHLFSLPSNLSAYEMLCCAAVLLLLGMKK